MKHNDKYGFTEIIPDAIDNRADPIGAFLQHPGYIEKCVLDGVVFQRYYWKIKLVFERELETIEEKEIKQKFCKEKGLMYIGLMKGEHITAKELQREIKKQGGVQNDSSKF